MGKPQIFCFTYAGGSASFFDGIEKELSDFDLVKIEYAGHGERRKEPFYNDFNELANDVFRILKDRYAGGNYALFGYSMGSISLVEVFKRIAEELVLPMPQRVFLAAHEPHTKAELVGFSPHEVDEWVKERTIQFGALPESMIHNRVFWRMYLPLFRVDYTLISKYRFEELALKTNVPATVFYSETDTPYDEMRLWGNYFIGECEYIRYEGKHFFIRQHQSEMAENIRSGMYSLGRQSK